MKREIRGLAFIFPKLIEIKDSTRVAFDLIIYIT